MIYILTFLASTFIWLLILLLPWQPWRVREIFNVESKNSHASLDDITVLIPARDEAEHILDTLSGLEKQASYLKVVLIDDQSSDDTADIAGHSSLTNLSIVHGEKLPEGWTGKLWALQQGLRLVDTRYVVLLDADIELQAGVLSALKRKMCSEGLQFVSLTAKLRMVSFWEKLLMPAFVYFFRLLYPFALSNNPKFKKIAAAAGGCIMTETKVLRQVNAFESLRDALIDDCTLARLVKSHDHRTWIGLTHTVTSHRQYNALSNIWEMVARTAFTQLRYSRLLLCLASALMILLYCLPLTGLFVNMQGIRFLALLSLLLMLISYLPVLRFYNLGFAWSITLPLAATLFLVMTWSSAYRYWNGQRSAWKGRNYQRESANKAAICD